MSDQHDGETEMSLNESIHQTQREIDDIEEENEITDPSADESAETRAVNERILLMLQQLELRFDDLSTRMQSVELDKPSSKTRNSGSNRRQTMLVNGTQVDV